ncbi:MAG: AEC family transporter [Myxococcales bacterium]|nr:AEC family transporter [Myxococcales bacterium]
MTGALLVLVWLLVGVLARKSGRLPERSPVVATRIVIDLALPALTLVTLHQITLRSDRWLELAVAVGTPWVVFGVTWLALAFADFPREVRACLLLTAGLANTSFVGFPLVEALWGREGLARAIWVDQGQFLVLSTVGVITASAGRGDQRPGAKELARRLLVFPPFVAFVLALLLRPVTPPAALVVVLEKLSLLVVPLALFAVGWQLRFDPKGLADHARPLLVGLSLRLAVAPLVVYLLVQRVLGSTDLGGDVVVAEAAMAPMITGALLAMDHDLSPRLASAMVGLGVPASLVTVPLWAWLLR